MTAVYLLVRHDDEDTAPVFVRSYESYQVAHAALERIEAHFASPERPEAPGLGPSGYVVYSVPQAGLFYAPGGDSVDRAIDEAASRLTSPDVWALYDACKAAYHWWLQANPVDPGAPEGSVYTIVPVEHESR